MIGAVAAGIAKGSAAKASKFSAQILKDVIVLAIIDKFWKRQVWPAIRRPVLIHNVERGNLVGIFEGVGVEDHSVKGAEDDRCRANPQGQRQNGQHGETRVLAEAADCVAKVLEYSLNHGSPMQLPAFFFHPLQAVELHQCAAARLPGAHPRRNVLGYALFQMKLQFGIELLFSQWLLRKS